MKIDFFVGTYTEPILFGTGEVFRGKGEGVYACSFDGKSIRVNSVIKQVNPSFLCVDQRRGRLYIVNEAKEFRGGFGGSVTEARFDGKGAMRPVQTLGTGGGDPCHVALSPDGHLVAVANFASGALTVFLAAEDGTLTGERQLLRHEGSGADPVRQKGPHAHSCIFTADGKLLVPDLGIDRVVCYHMAEKGVTPAPEENLAVMPGSGPRYGEFSADGKHFYLINELTSTIAHFEKVDGRLCLRDTVNTLPEDCGVKSICADLHLTPDGRWLYASNRGHDSIAAFRVAADGSLALIGHTPCGGRTPRQFQIDPSGRYLFVGNQDSDNIVVYEIGRGGRLEAVCDTPFPTPVCIRFVCLEACGASAGQG